MGNSFVSCAICDCGYSQSYSCLECIVPVRARDVRVSFSSCSRGPNQWRQCMRSLEEAADQRAAERGSRVSSTNLSVTAVKTLRVGRRHDRPDRPSVRYEHSQSPSSHSLSTTFHIPIFPCQTTSYFSPFKYLVTLPSLSRSFSLGAGLLSTPSSHQHIRKTDLLSNNAGHPTPAVALGGPMHERCSSTGPRPCWRSISICRIGAFARADCISYLFRAPSVRSGTCCPLRLPSRRHQ